MSRAQEAESYLENKVKVIMEPLVSSLLREKPDEPIIYMIEWLEKIAGVANTGNNAEREEYNSLKKEVRKYRKKYQEEDEDENLVTEEDLGDEDQDQVDLEFESHYNKNKEEIKNNRSSVSAEVYGKYNAKEHNFKARVIPKSEDQKKKLTERMMQSFLFNNLDDKDFQDVLMAMEEVRFKAGETVITQGDPGEILFLIYQGNLDCYKTFKKEEGEVWLKLYNPGEAFGELALLYNAPRAATIRTKTDCILYALDRATFNNIVKEAAIKKRERYETFLKSVDILSTIDHYELTQVSDALHIHKFKSGETIIKQGDNGDNFFILEEGNAYAMRDYMTGAGSQRVKEYKRGDYFGELALIKNEPRAASVIAQTDCKLISLDRGSFKRLLGPIETLLMRDADKYTQYVKK